MSKLKPCPFCGGHDVHAEEQINDYTNTVDFGAIICYDCLSSFFHREVTCMDELIEAWNRRANNGLD